MVLDDTRKGKKKSLLITREHSVFKCSLRKMQPLNWDTASNPPLLNLHMTFLCSALVYISVNLDKFSNKLSQCIQDLHLISHTLPPELIQQSWPSRDLEYRRKNLSPQIEFTARTPTLCSPDSQSDNGLWSLLSIPRRSSRAQPALWRKKKTALVKRNLRDRASKVPILSEVG